MLLITAAANRGTAVLCEGPCCGLREEQRVRNVSGTVSFTGPHLLLDQTRKRHKRHPLHPHSCMKRYDPKTIRRKSAPGRDNRVQNYNNVKLRQQICISLEMVMIKRSTRAVLDSLIAPSSPALLLIWSFESFLSDFTSLHVEHLVQV